MPEGWVEKVSKFTAPGLMVKPFKQLEVRVPSVAFTATTFVFKILTPAKVTTPAELVGVPEPIEVGTDVLHEESEYPVKVIVPA